MKTIFKSLIVLLSLTILNASFAQEFTLPNYEKVTLKNGLTVLLMQHDEVPLINVEVRVDAGAVHADIEGLAAVTADALLFGTQQTSKQALQSELDFIGANLATWADTELSGMAASFHKKDTVKVMSLLAESLKTPSFDKTEVKKHLKRYESLIAQRKESPKQLIDDYFKALYFGDHFYAKQVEATPESLNKIDRAAIQNFYQRYYQPNNTVISVVGDFELSAMKQQVNQLFGDWTNKHKQNYLRIEPAKAPTNANVLLVDKSDARETTFYIGGKGIARQNDDYIELQVVNTILGARFTSWLNDELRVNTGLTYGARSSFDALKHDGVFRISTFTQSSTTEQAIDLALKTYNRLWEQGIDKKTLDSAKAYVKGQFPLRFETSGQLADLLVEMEVFGIKPSFINQFNEKVNQLDVKRANELVKQYFPKDNLQFVLIGKADDIRNIAKKYGKVTELKIGETL